MSTMREEVNGSPSEPPAIAPLFCLFSAVLLLSTVPTMTKYVFQHSTVDPFGMALVRVGIGFVFLLSMTLLQDRRGLSALTSMDVLKLTLLGGLGVGSYVIAAWGLRLTSVTHYILIYSLLAPVTALISICLKKTQGSPLKIIGIAMALVGGGIAVSDRFTHMKTELGLGDLLILSFTIMMAAHLVWSANIVKRFGAMTANTVMFGSSTFLLLLGGLIWATPPTEDLTIPIGSSMLYIGVATASVFLLRYRALRSITPDTVAVYQNLTPVCAILFARFYLDEPIQLLTVLGGGIILVGAEVVRRSHHYRAGSFRWGSRWPNSVAGNSALGSPAPDVILGIGKPATVIKEESSLT